MNKQFKIHASADGQFYTTLSAQNGEVLNVSETLKTHRSAIKNILAVLKVIARIAYNPASWEDWSEFTGPRGPFEIKNSKDDKFYVILKAKNNEILRATETFNTHQSAIDNILATLRAVSEIAYHEAEWSDWEAFIVDTTVQKPSQAHG